MGLFKCSCEAEFQAIARIMQRIEANVAYIQRTQEKIMANQADIVAEIKAAKDEIAAAVKSLSDQLAAALANQTAVTPELQTAADDLKSFADGLATPPEPTP